MKTILFLDDNPERHEKMVSDHEGENHQIFHCWTYSQAIKCLEENVIDHASLDHDLDEFQVGPGPVVVESLSFKLTYIPDYHNGPRTGRDVVEWLLNNKDRAPKVVTVHSWNEYYAPQMVESLKAAGMFTRYQPFGRRLR